MSRISSPLVTTAALGLVAALALASAPSASAYTLVLKTGARVEVVEKPRFDASGWARVRMQDGRMLRIYRDVVSLSSTRRVNAARAPGASRVSPDAATQRRPEQRPTGERDASHPRVWTRADLERLRDANVSIAGAGGASEAAPIDLPAPAAERLDESEWRSAASALNGRIASLQRRIALLERQDSAWSGYVVATDTFGTTVGEASARRLKEIRQEASAARDALQQAQGELRLLKERARRAQVPPGWLR